MNKQEVKQLASTVADSIAKKGKVKPEKMDVNFIGVQKNEKGHFHSVLFEIDLVVAGDGGKINTMKTVHLPLNYVEDMVLDAVENEKVQAKIEAEKKKSEEAKAKAEADSKKQAFADAQKKGDAPKPVTAPVLVQK